MIKFISALFDRRPHIVIAQYSGLNGSCPWFRQSVCEMSRVEAERAANQPYYHSSQDYFVRVKFQAIALDDWAVMQEHAVLGGDSNG